MKEILVVRLPAERVIDLSKVCVKYSHRLWVILTYSTAGLFSTQVFAHVAQISGATMDNEPDAKSIIIAELGNVIVDKIKINP